MDARERLRRFLEQRREMGETELVLDGLPVEDVMRLLGARDRSAGSPDAAAPRPASRGESGEPGAVAPQSSGRESPGTQHAPGADWREMLRAELGERPGVRPAASPATSDTPQRDEEMPRKPKGAAPPGPVVDAETRDRDQERAARRTGEPVGQAGMEPSPSPGAATPDAAEGEEPPVRVAASAGALPTEGGLVVGTSHRELFGGPEARYASLADLAAAVAKCTKCPLYSTALNPVPGEGSPTAGVMCVGEAPGATEDETGRPFVGAAGQLLTKILAAIQLKREDVFIANVLKHRPPGNRNPRPEEVEACSPYLVRQLELIQPKVIIAFGTFAAQTLLNTKLSIGKLRGSVHRYYGIPLVVTYHPAALLRNPAWKRPTWEDVQLARRVLDSSASA